MFVCICLFYFFWLILFPNSPDTYFRMGWWSHSAITSPLHTGGMLTAPWACTNTRGSPHSRCCGEGSAYPAFSESPWFKYPVSLAWLFSCLISSPFCFYPLILLLRSVTQRWINKPHAGFHHDPFTGRPRDCRSFMWCCKFLEGNCRLSHPCQGGIWYSRCQTGAWVNWSFDPCPGNLNLAN